MAVMKTLLNAVLLVALAVVVVSLTFVTDVGSRMSQLAHTLFSLEEEHTIFIKTFIAPADTFLISSDTTPTLTAASWQVFDVETGTVLFSHEPAVMRPIASVTKLTTGAALLENQDLFAPTTITFADVATESRAGRLAVGETYRQHTLLFPLLLESSNDAAAALARTESGLVSAMNRYAAQLGLYRTAFADSSGLSNGNISTVDDLSVLLRHLYLNSRHLIDISSLKHYLTPEAGWVNNNPFRYHSGYIGGKHGYTPAAGQTAAVIFEESLNDYDRLIGYVLLGSSDLVVDTDKLRAHVSEYVRVD